MLQFEAERLAVAKPESGADVDERAEPRRQRLGDQADCTMHICGCCDTIG